MKPTPITLIRARSNPSGGFVEADESTGTILSEHQQQTEFLSQCLLYDDTAKSHQLGARIAQLQEDERRVRRGVRLMAGLVLSKSVRETPAARPAVGRIPALACSARAMLASYCNLAD